MLKCRRNSIILIFSAIIPAAIIALPTNQALSIPSWMIHRVCNFASTLFHELGHAVFGWLYGIPMVPAILTVFGSNQASGVAVQLYDRTWVLQIISIAALSWACYWLRKIDSYYFFPTYAILCFIVLTCFTGYHSEIISYMGHGSEILVGGFLLFKAPGNINMRNAAERWLNAFFGVYLLLQNIFFGYGLIYNSEMRVRYISHKAFGNSHNDLTKIAMNIDGLTLNAIAIFTIAFSILAASLACYLVYHLNREVRVRPKHSRSNSVDR